MDKAREVGGVEKEGYHKLIPVLSLLLVFYSSFSFLGGYSLLHIAMTSSY